MTEATRRAHALYERLPAAIRGEVDAAYDHAVAVFKSAALDTRNDDVAETLIAALTIYVLEANPKLYGELAPEGPEGVEPNYD
jgi:hypothetical protein